MWAVKKSERSYTSEKLDCKRVVLHEVVSSYNYILYIPMMVQCS